MIQYLSTHFMNDLHRLLEPVSWPRLVIIYPSHIRSWRRNQSLVPIKISGFIFSLLLWPLEYILTTFLRLLLGNFSSCFFGTRPPQNRLASMRRPLILLILLLLLFVQLWGNKSIMTCACILLSYILNRYSVILHFLSGHSGFLGLKHTLHPGPTQPPAHWPTLSSLRTSNLHFTFLQPFKFDGPDVYESIMSSPQPQQLLT